jgi:mannosyltransferase
LYELGFLKRAGVPITILHKRIAIKAADVIICISENTKKDLLLIYPELAKNKPIYVIPLATSLSIENQVNVKAYPRLVSLDSVTQKKYIIFVGSRKPLYKNFKAALMGFAHSELPGLGYYMICTGSPLTESEQNLIKKIGLKSKIIVVDYATKEELNYLYKQAFALVYPSIYEGFGLPPLEAMSCGCPVIVSNTSSLPEVVGDSGIIVDPQNSIDNISSSLNQLLDDRVREDYINQGLSRSQLFSWDRAATEHIKIYQSLLQQT